MKLLKHLLLLTVVFYLSQHLKSLKELPSFAFTEGISQIFSQITTISPVENRPLSQSTADLVAKIQKNELMEIEDIWSQLGIKSTLFKDDTPYLAESFTLSIPPKWSSLYVFKITSKKTTDWQYLFFNIKNRSWNFWGHLDLPNQGLTEPISRTVEVENQTWLIITSKSNSPELPEMYQDRWYDLNSPKLKEVLGYYIYQDLPQPGFTKRYSALISQTGTSGGTYFTELNQKITYFSNHISCPHLETALSLSNNLRYTWDSYSQSFKNHQPKSDNFHTYGPDEILSRNYLQILDLATTGDLTQRNVIRDFLKLCGDSTEKRRISKILR